MHDDHTTRFERLFTDHYPAIAAYLLRRCGGQADAEDAAAEVFAVAWRRRHDLPAPPEDRLWLFGVARRVLANQQRSARRRERLWHRLVDRRPATVQPASGAGGSPVAAALSSLRPDDRELLTLVAWDGLEVAELASVLGVAAPVVSRRLYRARRRFAGALEAAEAGDAAPAGHVPHDQPLVPETSR